MMRETKTTDSIREMLLKRGVFAFRMLAGYIPPKTDDFGDLPTFRAVNRRQRALRHYKVREQADNGTWTTHIARDLFGEYDELTLRCSEPICCDCAWEIRVYFNFNLEVFHDYDSGKCCFCGGECFGTIPF